MRLEHRFASLLACKRCAKAQPHDFSFHLEKTLQTIAEVLLVDEVLRQHQQERVERIEHLNGGLLASFAQGLCNVNSGI